MDERAERVPARPDMLNDEIAQCLAHFFDGGRGPSHDRLTEEFRRKGLLEETRYGKRRIRLEKPSGCIVS